MADQSPPTNRESTINKNSTAINRNSLPTKPSFWAGRNSVAKGRASADDKIGRAYDKLHRGIITNKLGRNGQLRATLIKLSKNNFFLYWHSKVISLKIGRTNKSKSFYYILIQLSSHYVILYLYNVYS